MARVRRRKCRCCLKLFRRHPANRRLRTMRCRVRQQEFITLLSVAAAWPRSACAAMPVVGWLCSLSREFYASFVAAYRPGVNEAGYIEGHNVAIDYRWANGRYGELPAFETCGGKMWAENWAGGWCGVPVHSSAASPGIAGITRGHEACLRGNKSTVWVQTPLLPLRFRSEPVSQEIDKCSHLCRKQRSVRIECADSELARSPVGEQRHQSTSQDGAANCKARP